MNKFSLKILAHVLILGVSSSVFTAWAAQNNLLNPSMPILVEKLMSGQQCNISQASSALWIDNPQQLQAILKQMHSYILNAKITTPKVNFDKDGVIAVSMGSQRSGGYSLALSNSPIRVKNDTAILKLDWKKPAKGMMTTQMLTSPCLLLTINKGGYQYLRVVTLTGKTIGTVKTR